MAPGNSFYIYCLVPCTFVFYSLLYQDLPKWSQALLLTAQCFLQCLGVDLAMGMREI